MTTLNCGCKDKRLVVVGRDYAGLVSSPITLMSLELSSYIGFQYQAWLPSY